MKARGPEREEGIIAGLETIEETISRSLIAAA
jgi:hypothetical protein